MERKGHQYRLTLEYLKDNKGEAVQTDNIVLDFGNHDNIFAIIEMQKEKNIFEDKQQAVEFAIGLKLFGEVMLKNKENPLFEDLIPCFKDFMRKLKGR